MLIVADVTVAAAAGSVAIDKASAANSARIDEIADASSLRAK